MANGEDTFHAANVGSVEYANEAFEAARLRFKLFFYGEEGPGCPLSSNAMEGLGSWDNSIMDVVW